VEPSRHLLRECEAKLPALRADLAAGTGRIEIFMVPKHRYTPAVIAYRQALRASEERGTPIDPAVEQAIAPEGRCPDTATAPYPSTDARSGG
jgi:ABC-type dipeptide/oligopeptide/nickel transport system ATPase component